LNEALHDDGSYFTMRLGIACTPAPHTCANHTGETFIFKTVDEPLFAELAGLTRNGFARFQTDGML